MKDIFIYVGLGLWMGKCGCWTENLLLHSEILNTHEEPSLENIKTRKRIELFIVCCCPHIKLSVELGYTWVNAAFRGHYRFSGLHLASFVNNG